MEEGLLTAEESVGMKPNVQISVKDRRVDRDVELPKLSEQE